MSVGIAAADIAAEALVDTAAVDRFADSFVDIEAVAVETAGEFVE